MFCVVQVSKTDPSPKREMPTMILFNVVFALRVCKDFLNLESKYPQFYFMSVYNNIITIWWNN